MDRDMENLCENVDKRCGLGVEKNKVVSGQVY